MTHLVGDAGFPKARRVRRRAEFLHVQDVARRVTTASFYLLVAANRDKLSPSRLGIVVTRKIGDAVTRNRVKRLCRECFRLRAWLPAGVDLVVVARPAAARDGLSLKDVQTEWAGVSGALGDRARDVLEALADPGARPHVPGAKRRTP